MIHSSKRLLILFLAILLTLTGCSTSPPPKKSLHNICSIYYYDDDWKEAANKAFKRWGTPPYIALSIIYQESTFNPHARPKREYMLGFIPMGRASSAYGYAQATDEAWHDYMKNTKRWRASRSDVEDALDFIGWYNYMSYKRNRISRKDPFKLYLAYHEGHTGYKKRTYLKKGWLIEAARKVSKRARKYKKQYQKCR